MPSSQNINTLKFIRSQDNNLRYLYTDCIIGIHILIRIHHAQVVNLFIYSSLYM